MKRHDDLLKVWKCTFPATLAGRVEIMLWDEINQRPIYGARAILLESLLEWWIAREEGKPLTPVPSIQEIRARALGYASLEGLRDALSQP